MVQDFTLPDTVFLAFKIIMDFHPFSVRKDIKLLQKELQPKIIFVNFTSKFITFFTIPCGVDHITLFLFKDFRKNNHLKSIFFFK